MSNFKKNIGSRISAILEEKNIKQKDLASALGITANTVSYFISGARTPNTEQIILIANFLNVSTDYLLGTAKAKTTDIELKQICEYTGLSDKATEKLHKLEDTNDHLLSAYAYPSKNPSGENLFRVILTGEDLDKLNFLIEDDEFYNLLYFIREYSRTRLNKDLNTPDFESLSDIDKTVAIAEYSDLDDHENLMLFRAQQTFIDIIKNIGTRTIKESKNYHQLPLFNDGNEE